MQHNELRYSMLETIREYAREKLIRSGEAPDVQEKHAVWFLTLAEQSELEIHGVRQKEWLERLHREHDNLRAALRWSLQEPDQAETALRMAAALFWFWNFAGYLSEGRAWLKSALRLGSMEREQQRAT